MYEGWVHRQKRGAIRWLVILLVAVALGWLVLRLRDVLIPFGIAFFLASLLDPVVNNLQRRGRSRGWAVGSIFALVFTMIVLVGALSLRYAIPQMKDLAANSKSYSNTVTTRVTSLYESNRDTFKRFGIEKNPIKDRSGPVATAVEGVLENLKVAVIGIAGQVLWLIIIPLSLFYFLLDYPNIRAKLISFVPVRQRASVDKMSLEIVEIFSAYVRGLAKVCALYAVSASVLFTVFGLRYSLFLGMAAGVLYAVPYVGPAIAMASAGIVAFTMGGSIGYASAVVAVFAAMHVAFDYVLTPRVVGGSVGLHPLVNVFALMAGATLFGVWGMLLAVPVAASIQMILLYFFPKLSERPVLESDYFAMEEAAEEGEAVDVIDVPAEGELAGNR
jgi:predicted PurR-regulated permease PerM